MQTSETIDNNEHSNHIGNAISCKVIRFAELRFHSKLFKCASLFQQSAVVNITFINSRSETSNELLMYTSLPWSQEVSLLIHFFTHSRGTACGARDENFVNNRVWVLVSLLACSRPRSESLVQIQL